MSIFGERVCFRLVFHGTPQHLVARAAPTPASWGRARVQSQCPGRSNCDPGWLALPDGAATDDGPFDAAQHLQITGWNAWQNSLRRSIAAACLHAKLRVRPLAGDERVVAVVCLDERVVSRGPAGSRATSARERALQASNDTISGA